MNFRLTILLLGCLLTACGQEAGPAAENTSSPDTKPARAKPLLPKLEWNVEMAYWEEVAGKFSPASAAGASQMSVAPLESFAFSFDSGAGAGASAGGALGSDQIERVLRKTEPRAGLRLGKSGYALRSPILAGLIPRHSSADASLGRKILSLPIVNWFVPLPMPEPPGGGKYFLWGERDEPWCNIGRPAPGPGAMDNGM